MKSLKLKATEKPIQEYYRDLTELKQMRLQHEGAVAPAFSRLLHHCAKQLGLTLSEQHTVRHQGRNLRFDAAFIDEYKLMHGVWEAKDSRDKLEEEVKKKFKAGYPKDNIMFQSPQQVIIWQNGQEVFNQPIDQPAELVRALKLFFEYQPPNIEEWERAITEFQGEIPILAQGLLEHIDKAYRLNRPFRVAFDNFSNICRQAINPNLATAAIKEMLIQHLLTERVFRKVFNHPDFSHRNAIATEIERVITALTSAYFKRDDFLKRLDPFYLAIERNAALIESFSEKQAFLNTVYERFFQGYSVRVADTHGIVYTPQEVVDFMVNSVEYLLEQEFGCTLSSEGVEIIDPFVGTGNFMIRLMRQIKRSQLPYKYKEELFCNEVLLLPYYIANLNIEHEYYELTGTYQPFEGISFVDTFELAEPRQLPGFSEINTLRVNRQKKSEIFVIIGNPPYNTSQVNENDNNRNRKYPTLDKSVANSYVKDSQASNKNQLSDPYVKAIRWAADRIGKEGIVAFVTNNSFIDGFAFDGMRKHLATDFTKIYHINLKGNARTSGERRRQEGGNVFHDTIRVSVGITFFIKNPKAAESEIYIYTVDDYLKSREKRQFLSEVASIANVNFQRYIPDENHVWLTTGMSAEFDTLLPLGSKAEKGLATVETIFQIFSNGIKTNRDAWAYNFSAESLTENISRMINNYNVEVFKWQGLADKANLDDFVEADSQKISWSAGLKQSLLHQTRLQYSPHHLRTSLYRPFVKQFVYFDKYLTERRYQFPKIFPTPETERENLVICLNGVGMDKPFFALMVSVIPDVQFAPNGQCFPFYTYAEDGTARQENITDWALEKFQRHYADPTITKWDIFYSIYALLHQPTYRQKYAANLRRDLPHIPFVTDIHRYATLGHRLAELHVHYDQQPEYPLEWVENPAVPVNWRVERMKLIKPPLESKSLDLSKGDSNNATVVALSANLESKSLDLSKGDSNNATVVALSANLESKSLDLSKGDSNNATVVALSANLESKSLDLSKGDKSKDLDSSSSIDLRGELIYNDFLTLRGIPATTFDYRLGNRSALEWVVDQYQVHTDKRSGITNDPNNLDDERAILRLIGQVITVSVETVKLVGELEN